LAPYTPLPLVVALEQSYTRRVDEYLETGTSALLESERLTPAVAPTLVAAITRLGESGAERACELALRAATLLGASGPDLAALARTLGERVESPRLARETMELGLSFGTREERAATLRSIAEHHRKLNDAPAELRALLRLLAVAPRNPEAVDRIAAIH